ncbi:MAG: tRNA glutamyl-Q(34) synthetase GluQRS [Raoultibacter sp.]
MSRVVGRFAPSPTGYMHAGNIFAALVTWLVAKSQGGEVVLRIEDLDPERSKSCYIDALQRDFEFLGLTWDRGPYFQSARSVVYQEAFEALVHRNLIYPCFCTRADLHAASAPHFGEKPVYPGTCRTLSSEERLRRETLRHPAMRLVVPDATLRFTDGFQGDYDQNLKKDCGDFIVRRSDGAFAYQLAVVLDDAEQGITSVVRGIDLLCSTPQQLHLQDLFGFQHPTYAHVPLLVNNNERRLSKRDHAAGINELRDRFKTPEAIIGQLSGRAKITPSCDPISPAELLSCFSFEGLKGRQSIIWT